MIDDLDRSLEELLRRELVPELVQQVTITFVTPDAQFPPAGVTLPAIDLFLYDIRENEELRSNEPELLRRDDGSARWIRPPVRVDCNYLITAWPGHASQKPAHDEHRLLGAVFSALLKHRTLPRDVLRGALQGQDVAPPATMIRPGGLSNSGEFWQAMGGRPKASLAYCVTLAFRVEPVEAAPLIREIDLTARPIGRNG